jgi:predicted phage terminase large subunit-like protein
MAPHLDRLSEALLDTVRQGGRLMVEMPPRHGKSELVSHWLPVWFLERWPQKRVILSSYEADFAASWGRKVRNSITENAERLSVRVSDDSAAAFRWDTTVGGGMVTAGVGGPITGRGADLLIVDDPVKNAEEADSPTFRDRAWEWWRTTAYTRLEPGGAAVLVMTRWHQDDLAGRLLAQMQQGGERWDVLSLPALAEGADPLGRGLDEPLWRERYDAEALARIRQAIGSRAWASLYQQHPLPAEGNLFKRQWFPIVDAVPADCKRVRYWDFAATEPKPGSDPDWTAGVRLGLKDGIYYVEDVRHVRASPLGVETLVRQSAELDGSAVPVWIEQEPGSSGVNTIDNYTRRVLSGWNVRGDKVTGNKLERMDPLAAQAEAGNVRLVRGPWNGPFLDEAESIPQGHDDMLDAAAGAMQKLSRQGVGFG